MSFASDFERVKALLRDQLCITRAVILLPHAEMMINFMSFLIRELGGTIPKCTSARGNGTANKQPQNPLIVSIFLAQHLDGMDLSRMIPESEPVNRL
jgi:hypothetical protein